jgi:hypothetical protein
MIHQEEAQMERDGEAFQDAVIVTDESAEFFRKIAKIQRERDLFHATLIRIAEAEHDKTDTKPDLVRAAQNSLMRADEGRV